MIKLKDLVIFVLYPVTQSRASARCQQKVHMQDFISCNQQSQFVSNSVPFKSVFEGAAGL